VCAYQKLFTIEGWDNPSHIQNIMKKIEKNNQKVEKVDRIVSQVLNPRLKHDKIQTQ
jgi:hypothetical protein